MGFRIENGVLKKYTEEYGGTRVVIPDGVTAIGFWSNVNKVDRKKLRTK